MPRNRKKRTSPERLDLHGIRHERARQETIWFIEDRWGSGKEVHIITGYSGAMQDVVEKVLNEYKLEYEIGDDRNSGYIRSWL